MARPGIMIFFDVLEPLQVLSDADRGKLFVAMLEYGKNGTLPHFDGVLAIAWGFVKPKLDRDEESYENTKIQRQYAAFCKKRNNLGLPKIPLGEWLNMDSEERERAVTSRNEPKRAVDFVDSRYPTTTATATATAAATTNTTASTSAAASATTTEPDNEDFAAATATDTDRVLKIMNGKLGQGVIVLSEHQIDSLLDAMGLDMFDHYVEKLADYIIRKNAKPGSHYDTILKWWRQDTQKG